MENISKKILDTVSKNGKIISTRLTESYFINNDLGSLYYAWIKSTESLREIYASFSDRLTASIESTTPLLCLHCQSNYRMITRCDKTHKKILSKYCSAKCAASSSHKVSAYKSSITPDIIEKAKAVRKSTMLDKYGYEYNSQRPEIKKKISTLSRVEDDIYLKLSNYDWVYNEYVTNNKSLSQIGYELGIYYGTVGEYVKNHNITIRPSSSECIPEIIIRKFLDNNNIEYIHNDTSILYPKHIDFFIPSKNIGIECNGLYWHSENIRGREYHLDKTVAATSKGVSLIHFTSSEIINKPNIVFSIIQSKLGISSKIYARKCVIAEINTKEEKQFFEMNHIQGYVPSKYCYGLLIDGQIVACMSFGIPRYDKNHEYELLRFSSLCGYTVVGGMSKLLNYFIHTHKSASIISYCDRSRSTGNAYECVGFHKIKYSKPSYIWFKGNVSYSRYQTIKSNLPKILGDKFDNNLSEKDNMENNGFKRIYNCGNIVYSYKG